MKKRNLKELLMQVLEKNHYLTVSETLVELEKMGRSCNKTSIYRNIEKLIEEKQVCRHSFGTDKVYYELRGHHEQHHHDHFVCEKCHKIESLDCSIEVVKVPNNYQVDHHHVTFFGTCNRCQKHVKTHSPS